uniref:Tissue factor pathway inhibitor n=1 Tax=Anolis carolinensis TaxID=28377 RepID=H9GB44_ANOCA
MERFTMHFKGFQKREEPQETFLFFSHPEFCHFPRDPGPCKTYMLRYFHNTKSNKCEELIYGGCHGNKNNFKTFDSCHYTCVGNSRDKAKRRRQETFLFFSPPEFCHLPPDTGPCKAYMPRYFYNPKSNRCEEFIYGGCRGNKNNFKTFKSCHYSCVGKWGEGNVILVGASTMMTFFLLPAHCNLPPDYGGCRGYVTRYYYNPTSNRCETFTYSGCTGNGNNFQSQYECLKTCDKMSPGKGHLLKVGLWRSLLNIKIGYDFTN